MMSAFPSYARLRRAWSCQTNLEIVDPIEQRGFGFRPTLSYDALRVFHASYFSAFCLSSDPKSPFGVSQNYSIIYAPFPFSILYAFACLKLCARFHTPFRVSVCLKSCCFSSLHICVHWLCISVFSLHYTLILHSSIHRSAYCIVASLSEVHSGPLLLHSYISSSIVSSPSPGQP